MGRPRGGKVSSSSDAPAKVDAKSKVIRTSTRERKEILHNYNEDSHSESEEHEEREEPEVVSDFEQSLSESISEGESSGSEYGVKKSKKSAKVSPRKGGRGSVGRGRGKGSPKGKGKRGAAAKPKGRPGRKPKAPSTPVTKTRPSRGQPNKRMKYRERSDSEEESEPELSDESEPEEPIESESDVEDELPKSDSDGESKSRKRKAPQSKGGSRGRPAKAASPASTKNNVKASAKNGSEKKESKNKLSEESDEFDEEDGVVERKKEKIEKKVVTSNGESSEDGGVGEDNGEKEKPDAAPTATKSDTKSKAAAPISSDDEEDVEMKSDEEDDKDSTGKPEEKTLKNATETDYKSLNFDCDKKTPKGHAWNFKISCWNVGGVKAWIKKNGLEYLKREDPDVMCLQEVRSSEKTQPLEVKSIENYPHIYWCFAEVGGHHGIGLLSKTKPLNVQIGFPVKDADSDDDKKFKNMFNKEGRLIIAEYDNIFVINAYVPNGGRGTKTDAGKPYPPRVTNGERQEWDRLFRNYVKELDAKKPAVVVGDLNVAHAEIDLANPKTNTCTAGFTKEEREGFDTLLQETGLIDSYRLLYPDEKGAYTFWSYMHNARPKNVGWRLDYFLVSEKLKESVAENTRRTQVLGSDHCPITLMIHV